MQRSRRTKPPIGVVFDATMGERIDTVLAMALAYALDGQNECRIAGFSSSKPCLASAALCDVLTRFYTGSVTGPINPYARAVALATEGGDPKPTAMLEAVLGKKTAEGSPAYISGIVKLTDTADPAPFLRNVLTASHDGNTAVVVAGPLANFQRMFALSGARDLAATKVRHLVIVPDRDGKIGDPSSARKVLAEWPGPIVLAGEEASDPSFPGASVETAFNWTPHHPVADAYKAFRPMPYDAPGSALAAALFAVKPKDEAFTISDPGVISVDDSGILKWTPKADGTHRKLGIVAGSKEQLRQRYVELVSAKPVERGPRGLPKKVEEEERRKRLMEQEEEQLKKLEKPPV
ncbi:MAG TPA: hypothetical protein VE621_15360 [Bryobacteraceae bacterium]|jgi:hypothetical protein|nr:hypothetical protein [Bryobacteraceae bacterium]